MKFFSGTFKTTTTITYQDAAGTEYTMTIIAYSQFETFLGIIFLVIGLIMFIAIVVAIMRLRR